MLNELFYVKCYPTRYDEVELSDLVDSRETLSQKIILVLNIEFF